MDVLLKHNNLILIFSLGISLFISTYISFLYNVIKNKRLRFSMEKATVLFERNRKIQNIKKYFLEKRKEIVDLSKKEKVLIVSTVLMMMGISKGFKALFLNMVLGLILSVIVIKLFKKIKRDITKTKKLKEITILFEGIEIYTKAGYSLVQALRAAKLLTNTITPSIDKCLNYWGSGPRKALEILKNELDLEESDALILLMMHLETAGVKNLQGILQREAHNIERLQKMKTEIKIAHRPLILMIYRILPLASIMGIIIGTLLFRVYYVLSGIGILNTNIF